MVQNVKDTTPYKPRKHRKYFIETDQKKQNNKEECREEVEVLMNKARCKRCEDIIESKFRHDFQQCKCGAIYVDGGDDYCRMGGNPDDFDFNIVEEAD